VLKTVPAWFFLKDDSADDDVMGQLEYGRRFLRAWLEVTAMGLVCCPMTPIVHDPKTNQALAAHAGIRAPERLACVWRVGALPKGGVLPTHARLSLDDILL
jgi:hypothetical protein